MPEIKMPGHIDLKIDFDDLRFPGHGYNYQPAIEIAAILMSTVSIDDLRFPEDLEKWQYNSSVGTGGSMNMPCINQSVQRSLLATHLSCYSKIRYSHCYLTVYEYQVIKDLRDELRDDWVSDHRKHIQEQDLALLDRCVTEIAKEFARKDPKFLITVLKDI